MRELLLDHSVDRECNELLGHANSILHIFCHHHSVGSQILEKTDGYFVLVKQDNAFVRF